MINNSQTYVPRRFGIVGGGTIGVGLALAVSDCGFPVTVIDNEPDVVESFARRLKAAQFAACLLGFTPRELRGEVICSTDDTALRGVDIVIENVKESFELKSRVLMRIAEIVGPEPIVAVNSSCIPICRLAKCIPKPSRLIGAHFMNPVPLKPVVEVIRGAQTSEATVEKMQAHLRAFGKRSIVVEDGPGFVINRVLMVTINEAIKVLENGRASARDIDELFQGCLAHSMGPLATADLIGLDTIQDSLLVLEEYEGGEQFRPAPLLDEMVAKGWLGQKSGQGFHTYT